MNLGLALEVFDELVPHWRTAKLVSGNRVIRAPHRDEKTASFGISESKGCFYDFGSGESGGAYAFAELMLGGEVEAKALIRRLEQSGGAARVRPNGADRNRNTERAKPAPIVEDLGPFEAGWADALKRAGRVQHGETLLELGARRLRVTFWSEKRDAWSHPSSWAGLPTMAEDSWKIWKMRGDEFESLTLTSASFVATPVVLAKSAGEIEHLWDLEGESDLVAAYEAGLEHAISSTVGAGSLAAHNRHLEQLRALPLGEVIVCRDRDKAGRDGAVLATDWYTANGFAVRVLDLPEELGEKGDLRDYLTGRPAKDDQPAVEPLGDAAALNALAAAAPLIQPPTHEPAGEVVVATANNEPDWSEEPRELPTEIQTPALPESLLPEPLRACITDAAERVSVPLEYIIAPMLVAAAAVVGRTLGIHPKRRDDWLVIPNLWGAIVGPPGVMKSAAVSEGTREIKRLAAVASDEFNAVKSVADAKVTIAEAREKVLKDEAKRAAKKPDTARLAVIQEQLEDIAREKEAACVSERRYHTQDATVEMLGHLLKENPNGLLILRDELSGFLRTLDKPGREGDREFFLESAEGTSGFTVDRIGRGTLHIPALTLSIFGGIQPGKLRAYIDGAMEHGAGADGLLQRFQLIVWPNVSADWRNVDEYPDSAARDRARAVFSGLDALDPAKVGARVGEHQPIPALRFGPEAQELFDEWRHQLEHDLRSQPGDRPAFTAHIAKYRSLMPGLALLFHLVETVDGGGGPGGPVSIESAQLAAAWVEYLQCHAQRVYATELEPGVAPAGALAAKIRAGAIEGGETTREIGRRGWRGLTEATSVHAGLEVLEAAGWLVVETVDTKGRPSERIRLHPKLRGGDHE